MADISLTGPIIPDSLAFCDTGYAVVAVAAGEWVYKDAATSDKFRLTDSSAVESARAYGMAVNTAAAGEPLTVAKSGTTITQVGTTFAKNVPLAVSTNAGKMAPVADVTSGLYGCLLGIGLSTTTFKIQIQITGVAT